MASPKQLSKLLNEVLEEITPEEGIEKYFKAFVDSINSRLKSGKIKAKCMVGGSVAKNTFLKNEHDIDLFVRFDYSYKDKDISKLLEKVLRSISKNVELVHGSRDYFHIRDKGTDLGYEIVPVLDITDPKKAVNVTDMSPLHVTWVRKNSKQAKTKRITDDIRLAKAFCKSAGVYGAESYIKGFSGHVLDILVIYYKGFINLLKASKKWKEKQVIDIYNTYKGQAFMKMNLSKLQSPLIIVDPVLPSRNAAAALGREKFLIFIKRASRFLKSPSRDFFVKKSVDEGYFRKLAGKDKLVLLKAGIIGGKEDVVGNKILKAFEYIKNKLEDNDFKLKKSEWFWDRTKEDAFLGFILDEAELPATAVREGPPIRSKFHAEDFRKKHSNHKVFEKSGKLYAEMKREFRTPESLVDYLIRDDIYIKERVKSIERTIL